MVVFGTMSAASAQTITDPNEIASQTFFHSEHGVLLNLEGERFLDETIGDQLNAIALVEQPEARAGGQQHLRGPFGDSYVGFSPACFAYAASGTTRLRPSRLAR